MRSPSRKIETLVVCALLFACRHDSNNPPVANPMDLTSLEDQSVAGLLSASDPEGQPLTFGVVSSHGGVVTSLTPGGAFVFEPERDFYGAAGFEFSVTDDHGAVARAKVSITIENVNDPPRLAAVPNLTNSPETEVLGYQLTVIDPDPDRHSFSISADDDAIVEAAVDPDLGLVFLKALQLGVTNIEVAVTDGEEADSVEFTFSAEEVRKGRVLRYADTPSGAVVLHNETESPVDFVLEHNGFPVFEDLDSIVQHVRAMPNEVANEHFGRKLWRFLRDSVYHEIPLETTTSITGRIFYDPWLTLNSLGWGLCGHVSGAFVVIAQAAGYEARVWGLSGHVVPEIKIDDRWSVYDPDLAVYYRRPDGTAAGVEELAADPSLITSPIDPIFAGSRYQFPYDPYIADIYSSTSDNFDGVNTFLPRHESPSTRIVLPSQARLTYPGTWTEAPWGRDVALSYQIPAYRQAMLELNAGWTGELQLPWMAWSIEGSGQVSINDELFVVGSPELNERLRNPPAPITSLQVYANDGIRIVFFINALHFDIRPQTSVVIRGFSVWGVGISSVQQPNGLAGGAELAAALRKPTPTDIR